MIGGDDIAMFWFSVLIGAGLVLFALDFAFRWWHLGLHPGRILAFAGTGMWTVAVAIFYFLWAGPQPKHARRR